MVLLDRYSPHFPYENYSLERLNKSPSFEYDSNITFKLKDSLSGWLLGMNVSTSIVTNVPLW